MVRGNAIKWCMGVALVVSCAPALGVAGANRPVRVHDRILSRAESFFGVHFDFHAEMDDPELGGNTTPEKVREILGIIKPDYVEIDTKGHPGVSSYPTAVGNHAGRFARDPLKVWREETAKAGVALYAHYSSIWDRRAYELHPEWAPIGADGKPVKEVMSLLGPYDDQLLIPQLKELACKYDVDGVWIDGDDWAMVNDYSPAVLAQFKAETGIGTAPRKPGDPNWHEWRAFNRELFRRHLKKYASELKKAKPGFQICSNGAFGARMPEAPLDEVDFLSLDICGRSCVDVSRYMSRLFAPLDKPWDLMSWSFYEWRLRKLDPPASRKPAIQLMREAACIIAQGGAYQAVFSQAGAGDPPKRDGSIDIDKIKLFADVRNFCLARKPFCFKARVVPQIGVYQSAAGTYAVGDASVAANPFKGANLTIGIVVALMDAHRCVTVLRNDPKIRLEDYPVIAVCDWDVLDDGIPERLEAYVRNGGKLFVSGPSVALFGKMLAGAPRKGNLHLVGKGAVFTTDVPVSKSYVNPSDKIRRLVAEAFDELDPDPAVRLGRDLPIDLSLMRTADGELAIHLVNVSGDHRRALLVHSIDPVWQVPVSVRLPARPKSVRIEPGPREVEWKWAEGRLSLIVSCVPIHEIVVIDDLGAHKKKAHE